MNKPERDGFGRVPYQGAPSPFGKPDIGRYGPVAAAVQPGANGEPIVHANSQALGALTGAPPRVVVRVIMITPFGAAGSPTQIVGPERDSRVVTLTGPSVGFSIFVGPAGISPGDFALPGALPYDFVLAGFDELYATTDSPVFLPLRVQIAPLLIGDRERRPDLIVGRRR